MENDNPWFGGIPGQLVDWKCTDIYYSQLIEFVTLTMFSDVFVMVNQQREFVKSKSMSLAIYINAKKYFLSVWHAYV